MSKQRPKANKQRKTTLRTDGEKRETQFRIGDNRRHAVISPEQLRETIFPSLGRPDMKRPSDWPDLALGLPTEIIADRAKVPSNWQLKHLEKRFRKSARASTISKPRSSQGVVKRMISKSNSEDIGSD